MLRVAASFLFLALSLWPFPLHRNPTIKKTSLELPADPGRYQTIRISIGQGLPSVSLESDSPYRVLDGEGKVLLSADRLKGEIRPLGAGLALAGHRFHQTALRLESSGGGLQVNGRTYRGSLWIHRENEHSLLLVNVVLLEDYLKGVLPWEANPAWTAEALKAQAIASRTYALFKVIENRNGSFDLSHDVMSQVYGGRTSEKAATSEAVDATRGVILTYRGKIFPAYFHSTCGGGTTHAEYIWDVEPHPAFKGVLCNFCRISKHYHWQAEYTTREIEAILKRKKIFAPAIERIVPADKDTYQRARTFVVETRTGKYKIHGNDFRLAMDPSRFKSTLIDKVDKEGDRFIFKGRGWGHGVGLCQYGMKALADLGYTAEEILKYYYPGAEIRKYY